MECDNDNSYNSQESVEVGPKQSRQESSSTCGGLAEVVRTHDMGHENITSDQKYLQ